MKPSPSSGGMSDPEVEFITLEGDHRYSHPGRHSRQVVVPCLDLTGYYKLYTAHSPAMRSSRRFPEADLGPDDLVGIVYVPGVLDGPGALRPCWLHMSPPSAVRLWPNRRTPSATAEYLVQGSPSLQSK